MEASKSHSPFDTETLGTFVAQLVRKHIAQKPLSICNLYRLVIDEVEAPLLEAVMMHSQYNQSKAAEVLGLSRTTLRDKLVKYFGNRFFPTAIDEIEEDGGSSSSTN